MKIKKDAHGYPYAEHVCQECKHTPTPWMSEGRNISREEFIHAIGSTLDEADAAFIVRCCNSHESLKAFLKAFVDYENTQKASPVNLVMDAQKLLDKLEAK